MRSLTSACALILAAPLLWWSTGALRLAGASRSGTGDTIILDNATPGDGPVLAVDGQMAGGECVNDEMFEGIGPFTVGDLVTPTTCPAEVVIFSKRRALTIADPAWTASPDQIQLKLSPAQQEVELDAYVVAIGMRAENWARNDLMRARTVYASNRVGLTFTESKFMTSSQLTEAEKKVIGDNCQQAKALKQNPSLYSPQRLNVYFVQAVVADEDDTWRGYNCFEKKPPGNTAGAPNIIYISIARHSPTTLAHEIGHALSLQDPEGHTGSSHLLEEDFDLTNIMWTDLDSREARAQKHFSLGQAFRMNIDKRSWLNRGAAAITPAGVKSRLCHENGATDARLCPRLAFDVP
jgi:hypothetical protein